MTCQPVSRLNSRWRSTSCSMERKKMSARVLISILRARFHPLKYDSDHGIGQAGEVIVAVAVAFRKDPRCDDLIHGAKETMRRNGHRKIRAEHARFLALAQHAFDYVKIFHQQVVGKLPQKLGAVPQLGLEDDCQTAV